MKKKATRPMLLPGWLLTGDILTGEVVKDIPLQSLDLDR